MPLCTPRSRSPALDLSFAEVDDTLVNHASPASDYERAPSEGLLRPPCQHLYPCPVR